MHSTQPFIALSIGFSEHRNCVQSPQAAAKRGEEKSRTSCSGTVVAPSAPSRDHLNAPAPHSAKARAMQQGSVFRAPSVPRHAMRQNATLQRHGTAAALQRHCGTRTGRRIRFVRSEPSKPAPRHRAAAPGRGTGPRHRAAAPGRGTGDTAPGRGTGDTATGRGTGPLAMLRWSTALICAAAQRSAARPLAISVRLRLWTGRRITGVPNAA